MVNYRNSCGKIIIDLNKQLPVTCWIKCLNHVLPDPGKLARAVSVPGGALYCGVPHNVTFTVLLFTSSL